jgi:integrase
MDIGEKIKQANERLKAAHVGVSILRSGDRLYLQATLPPKPGNERTKPYQQKISLHLYANPAALAQAEKEARKVGALVACREFDWKKYLVATDPEPEKIRDWVRRFEENYFLRRSDNPKSRTTWRTDYSDVFRQLPQEQVLTPTRLITAIAGTKPDSRTRKRYCIALGALAKFAGLDFDAKPYKGRYSPKHASPRDLPTDDLIAQTFFNIPAGDWRWAYGMLAVYGLRPHELFYLDFANLGSTDWISLLDGKTGPRRIWPIYPEWIELFELREFRLPKVTGRDSKGLGNRVSHAFKRLQVPFRPYDLRHCWAIRALEFGLDISLAAQQMGHSAQVHSELYHHWITDSHHQKAFEALMRRSDRPLPPQVLHH